MELSEKNFVKLMWVPAHHGSVGNEEADEPAHEGSQKLFEEQGPALFSADIMIITDTLKNIGW